MNKNVIYVEPKDDITDIINKIEGSREKIVAIVPPKKGGVLRSVVNIKLIAKAGDNNGKSVVLVTDDSSIVKLASAARLLVTRDLQTPPTMPEPLALAKNEAQAIATDENGKEIPGEEFDEKDGRENEGAKDNTTDEDSDGGDAVSENSEDESDDKEDTEARDNGCDEADDKPNKKSRSSIFGNNPVLAWIQEHKKLTIIGGILLLLLVLILIWAFVIAPAVRIKIDVRTLSQNFSEAVSFTQNLSEESATDGKFYLTEKKLEAKDEIEFEATGSKNVGEKAKGQLVAYTYFDTRVSEPQSVGISEGTTFSIDGLLYAADSNTSLVWTPKDIDDFKSCLNYETGNLVQLLKDGCLVSRRIDVTATAPGTRYNIAAASSGWTSSNSAVGVYSDNAMSGGTDKTVTIVEKSDIEKALADLKAKDGPKNKEALLESIGADNFAIESSYKQTNSDPVSSPAVGEEVAEGKKATLSVTTTDSIFVLDKTKVVEFIAEKAKLPDGYKIYNINEPFVENFANTEAGMTGKLKTSVVVGPKITENEVMEIARGKGIGTAQRDIRDSFQGISSIRMETSFPWVTSVPADAEKISVEISVEE